MNKLHLEKKVNKNGFMLAADSAYFNKWAKILFFSIKEHAPWAHVHFHVFDPSDEDLRWLKKQPVSFSYETTPTHYSQDQENKVHYWSAARYMRFVEIYEDDTVAIDLDVDSVMVKNLPEEKFLLDLQKSWVPIGPKRLTMSLCSAIGFGRDSARYVIREKLKNVYDHSRLSWALDQTLCDEMLNDKQIEPMDLRYTFYKFGKSNDNHYIITGKGDRAYKPIFLEAQEKYKKLL